jgi:hypothetical protein
MAPRTDKTFTLRFSTELAERIMAAAKARGESRNAWMEAAALSALETPPPARPTPQPSVKPPPGLPQVKPKRYRGGPIPKR